MSFGTVYTYAGRTTPGWTKRTIGPAEGSFLRFSMGFGTLGIGKVPQKCYCQSGRVVVGSALWTRAA